MKQLLLIVIKGKFQVKYWNVINFPSMWWIQTKQCSKRRLESLHLCLDSSRSCKRNQKICQPSIVQKTSYPGILSDEDITAFEDYFFKKATSEVKEFVREDEYQKISFQKDGILYYKGRILTTERINATCEMSTVMKDFRLNTYCVSVICKNSPLA